MADISGTSLGIRFFGIFDQLKAEISNLPNILNEQLKTTSKSFAGLTKNIAKDVADVVTAHRVAITKGTAESVNQMAGQWRSAMAGMAKDVADTVTAHRVAITKGTAESARQMATNWQNTMKGMAKGVADTVTAQNVAIAKGVADAVKLSVPATTQMGNIRKRIIGSFIEDIQYLIQIQARWYTSQLLIFGTIRQIIAAFREYAEFNETMAQLNAITLATAESSRKMERAIMDTAAATGINKKELAETATLLARVGLNADEIAIILPIVAKMVKVTGEDMKFVVDVLATIMAAWNKDVSEMPHVADVLSAALNKSKLTIQDLATALNHLAPVAIEVGLDVSDFAGILAIFRDQGYKAHTAARALRQMIMTLLDPSKEARETFKKLGLTMEEIQPGAVDLYTIFDRLKNAQMSNADAAKIFTTNVTPLAMLISRLGGQIFKDYAAMLETTASLEEMWNERVKGLVTRLGQLTQRISNLVIALLSVFGPAIDVTIDSLNLFFGILDTVIRTITDVIRSIYDWIKATSGVAGYITKLIVEIAALIVMGKAVQIFITSLIIPVLGQLGISMAAITALAGTLWTGLKAIFTLGGIGAAGAVSWPVLITIAALVVGVGAAYKAYQWWTGGIKDTTQALADVQKKIVDLELEQATEINTVLDLIRAYKNKKLGIAANTKAYNDLAKFFPGYIKYANMELAILEKKPELLKAVNKEHWKELDVLRMLEEQKYGIQLEGEEKILGKMIPQLKANIAEFKDLTTRKKEATKAGAVWLDYRLQNIKTSLIENDGYIKVISQLDKVIAIYKRLGRDTTELTKTKEELIDAMALISPTAGRATAKVKELREEEKKAEEQTKDTSKALGALSNARIDYWEAELKALKKVITDETIAQDVREAALIKYQALLKKIYDERLILIATTTKNEIAKAKEAGEATTAILLKEKALKLEAEQEYKNAVEGILAAMDATDDKLAKERLRRAKETLTRIEKEEREYSENLRLLKSDDAIALEKIEEDRKKKILAAQDIILHKHLETDAEIEAAYKKLMKTIDEIDEEAERKSFKHRAMLSKNWKEVLVLATQDTIANMKSWQEALWDGMKGFFNKAEGALSDFFFNILKGKMNSFADFWKSMWDSLLRTVADSLAKMAAAALWAAFLKLLAKILDIEHLMKKSNESFTDWANNTLRYLPIMIAGFGVLGAQISNMADDFERMAGAQGASGLLALLGISGTTGTGGGRGTSIWDILGIGKPSISRGATGGAMAGWSTAGIMGLGAGWTAAMIAGGAIIGAGVVAALTGAFGRKKKSVSVRSRAFAEWGRAESAEDIMESLGIASEVMGWELNDRYIRQAHQMMGTLETYNKLDAVLAKIVEDGKLTNEEMEEFRFWLQTLGIELTAAKGKAGKIEGYALHGFEVLSRLMQRWRDMVVGSEDWTATMEAYNDQLQEIADTIKSIETEKFLKLKAIGDLIRELTGGADTLDKALANWTTDVEKLWKAYEDANVEDKLRILDEIVVIGAEAFRAIQEEIAGLEDLVADVEAIEKKVRDYRKTSTELMKDQIDTFVSMWKEWQTATEDRRKELTPEMLGLIDDVISTIQAQMQAWEDLNATIDDNIKAIRNYRKTEKELQKELADDVKALWDKLVSETDIEKRLNIAGDLSSKITEQFGNMADDMIEAIGDIEDKIKDLKEEAADLSTGFDEAIKTVKDYRKTDAELLADLYAETEKLYAEYTAGATTSTRRREIASELLEKMMALFKGKADEQIAIIEDLTKQEKDTADYGAELSQDIADKQEALKKATDEEERKKLEAELKNLKEHKDKNDSNLKVLQATLKTSTETYASYAKAVEGQLNDLKKITKTSFDDLISTATDELKNLQTQADTLAQHYIAELERVKSAVGDVYTQLSTLQTSALARLTDIKKAIDDRIGELKTTAEGIITAIDNIKVKYTDVYETMLLEQQDILTKLGTSLAFLAGLVGENNTEIAALLGWIGGLRAEIDRLLKRPSQITGPTRETPAGITWPKEMAGRTTREHIEDALSRAFTKMTGEAPPTAAYVRQVATGAIKEYEATGSYAAAYWRLIKDIAPTLASMGGLSLVIKGLYRALLGREVESQAVLDYWIATLQDKGIDYVIQAMITGTEGKGIYKTYGYGAQEGGLTTGRNPVLTWLSEKPGLKELILPLTPDNLIKSGFIESLQKALSLDGFMIPSPWGKIPGMANIGEGGNMPLGAQIVINPVMPINLELGNNTIIGAGAADEFVRQHIEPALFRMFTRQQGQLIKMILKATKGVGI